MRIKVWILVLALMPLYAGIMWAADDKPEKPSGQAKAKFDIPIWHPDALWSDKTEALSGSGDYGFLDGPLLDIMNTAIMGIGPLRMGYGGPYGCHSYDPELGRVHTVTCNARGSELDGPFSRARLQGGWAYMDGPSAVESPDSRYLFVSERSSKVIRRFDLEKQIVTSIPSPGKGVNLIATSKGKIYFITSGGDVKLCDIDGKVEKTFKLQFPPHHSLGSLLLDEVNDRLYWSMGGGNSKEVQQWWFVGYFDLKTEDGIFHGVLPAKPDKTPRCWMRAVPGSFDNFYCYTQVGIYFGPDDPEHNFIYMGACDTDSFFRLDLKKKEVWACSKEKDGIRFVFDHPANTPTMMRGLMGQDINGSQAFWVDRRTLINRRIK